MGNFRLTDEYPEAKNQLVTEDAKAPPDALWPPHGGWPVSPKENLLDAPVQLFAPPTKSR
jgi:hypothetical protein